MSHRNSQPEIWISGNAQMPDACINCGMYTDRRMTSKYVGATESLVQVEPKTATGLGCLLLLLGPVGMLITLLLSLRKTDKVTKMKTITVKAKIRIPICTLCASENIVVANDADLATQQFAFRANQDFVRQYRELNGERL